MADGDRSGSRGRWNRDARARGRPGGGGTIGRRPSPRFEEATISRLFAALACVLLLAGPAHALEERDSDRVPVMFDIFTRAAFGIPLTILGSAAMIPVGFVTAITRPSEIDKPFRILVLGPVRYTWVDPLGYHPDPGTHPMVAGRDRGDRYVARARAQREQPPSGPPSGDY